jgi:hypothetical protein
VGEIRLVADRKAGSPEHISARPAVQRGGGTADKVVTPKIFLFIQKILGVDRLTGPRLF